MKNKPRILVVDSEVSICKMMRFMLSHIYELVFAVNGHEALKAFSTYCFDLILLDIVIPDLDGVPVWQRLRQCSDIPIIIFSALSRREDRAIATRAGANAYITKPFTLGELRQSIAETL